MSASATSGFALTEPSLAFSGTITPTRLSPTYRLGLVIVAVTMLLLPILYLGLIALTAAGVWWHATANVWLLSGRYGGHVRLLAYATPLVAGLVLMFFMVKPILARPAPRHRPLPIEEADERALFAFIDEICRQVGARRPQRVQVDCNVNASAGLMDSRFGLLRRDLVLTIGLPLVAGLSARELAGVLAHEFGHFAQGGGMRLTAVVRGVNAWFARVVYERDAWDEKLDRWTLEADRRLGMVLVVTRGGVWISRRILYGLMLGGHAISCFMLRQMEYDADSYEVKIAGSDAFIRTAARLRELSVGARLAYGDLRDGWSRGTLPVDLATLIVERTRRMPSDLLAHVHEGSGEATGWFDTHPSDADRVRAAAAAAAPGVLVGGDVPAVRLFRNFESLSAAETRRHFEAELSLDLSRVTLVDTDAAIVRSRQREENAEAIRQFFGKAFTPYRPVRLTLAELASQDTRSLTELMAAARRAMNAAEPLAIRACEEFDALEAKRRMAVVAAELFAAAITSVTSAKLDLPEQTVAAAESAERAAADRQQTLAVELEPFETAASTRLSCALLLMRVAGDGPPVEQPAMIVEELNAIASIMADIRELHRLVIALEMVHGNAQASEASELVATRLELLHYRMAACGERIREGLIGVVDPAAGQRGAPTFAERCGFPPVGSAMSASDVIDRVLRLYFDLIGHVAAGALREESQRSA